MIRFDNTTGENIKKHNANSHKFVIIYTEY